MDGLPRRALGVDLAWGEGNATGLAHLVESREGWRLEASVLRTPLDAIAAWVASAVPPRASVRVAVDAPLVARNPRGTRRKADAALSDAFRRFRAGALPVDERHAVRGAALTARLATAGIPLAVPGEGAPPRLHFETFPTAATIALFDLARPVGYKHGDAPRRREGLRRLQLLLGSLDDAALPLAETPALRELLATDPASLGAEARKGLEDRLDALIAGLVGVLAFTAPGRLAVYGEPAEGFIVVPHPPER